MHNSSVCPEGEEFVLRGAVLERGRLPQLSQLAYHSQVGESLSDGVGTEMSVASNVGEGEKDFLGCIPIWLWCANLLNHFNTCYSRLKKIPD